MPKCPYCNEEKDTRGYANHTIACKKKFTKPEIVEIPKPEPKPEPETIVEKVKEIVIEPEKEPEHEGGTEDEEPQKTDWTIAVIVCVLTVIVALVWIFHTFVLPPETETEKKPCSKK